MFCFFPPIWCHPHTQKRSTLFHGVRISIPNWKPSPNRTSMGCSQIAFPIAVLLKDDRTDSAQEERLGLPYWTMISAICRGRRIQIFGHSNFGIFNNFGASSIFTWVLADTATLRFLNFKQFVSIFHFDLGVSRHCVSCLSCALWQSGYDIHDFCCCHLRCWWSLFGEHCVRLRIVFYNITSEYNSTFVLLVLCLQFGILQMTDVHQWGKMNVCALRPCIIDHLWFTSDFCQVSRRNLFKFLPFFIHCWLLLRESLLEA